VQAASRSPAAPMLTSDTPPTTQLPLSALSPFPSASIRVHLRFKCIEDHPSSGLTDVKTQALALRRDERRASRRRGRLRNARGEDRRAFKVAGPRCQNRLEIAPRRSTLATRLTSPPRPSAVQMYRRSPLQRADRCQKASSDPFTQPRLASGERLAEPSINDRA
jgi:hypothetical protein